MRVPVLERLGELSTIDAALRTALGKLSDLDAERRQLETRRAQELERMQARKSEHHELRHASTQRAAEVDQLDERIRGYRWKLEHDIIAYKEMENLREQIVLLSQRLDRLAEESLAMLEQAEQDGSKLAQDIQDHEAQLARIDGELAKVAARRAELAAEAQELERQRQGVAGHVPGHVLEQYERLRAQVGDPLVTVVAGACGGCRLALSESTIERVREGQEVVACENCSRFLCWSR